MYKQKIFLGLLVILVVFVTVSYETYRVDPLIHFHAPIVDEYYYTLDNERSQNNGIARNMEYDSIVAGTSMAENFKTSELNTYLKGNFIKLCYSGGRLEEITDSIRFALNTNKSVKQVVRSIDIGFLYYNNDTAIGVKPEYLYNNSILDDYKYTLNRDILFKRIYEMEKNKGTKLGMTSYDKFGNWGTYLGVEYGSNSMSDTIQEVISQQAPDFVRGEEYERNLRQGIEEHYVKLANDYPEVDFYYFVAPYSVLYNVGIFRGSKEKFLEEDKQIIIEELLKCSNVKLFCFDDIQNLVCDLNNYEDRVHYAPWVNTYIVKSIGNGDHLMTKSNYKSFIERIKDISNSVDLNNLLVQEDYKDDFYQAVLFSQSVLGIKPIELDFRNLTFRNAKVVDRKIMCQLRKENNSEVFIKDVNSEYNYLVIKASSSIGEIYVKDAFGETSIPEKILLNDGLSTHTVDISFLNKKSGITLECKGGIEIESLMLN